MSRQHKIAVKNLERLLVIAQIEELEEYVKTPSILFMKGA